MKKKVITEKNLNLSEWTSAGPEAIAKVKTRNIAMKAAKEAKDGKINMRVNGADLEALAKLAEKKGIGYQTLLGMIIHQYIEGTLVDVEEARKILKVS